MCFHGSIACALSSNQQCASLWPYQLLLTSFVRSHSCPFSCIKLATCCHLADMQPVCSIMRMASDAGTQVGRSKRHRCKFCWWTRPKCKSDPARPCSNGLIIVWILHKGLWFEEMINNRCCCMPKLLIACEDNFVAHIAPAFF